jgi:hypothetical protein
MIICRSALLRKFQANDAEKIKTHIACSIFSPENYAVYEKMRKNTVDPGRPQVKIWRMHVVDWIPTATNTHSEYVILIAFPLQQWWDQRATKLGLYFTCRSCWFVIFLKPEIVSSFIQTTWTGLPQRENNTVRKKCEIHIQCSCLWSF